MRNFQDTFETRERSFISAFSICMTAPLGIASVNVTKSAVSIFCPVDPVKNQPKMQLKINP